MGRRFQTVVLKPDRTLVLFTSKEYDRIRYSIEQTRPQRVLVAVNTRMMGVKWTEIRAIEMMFARILRDTGFLDNEEMTRLGSAIKSRFAESDRSAPVPMSWDGRRATWRGIDFYDFENALGGIYHLVLGEILLQRHEVLVNLNGGTRPVAIAAFIATSLASSFVEEGLCQALYYHAATWKTDQAGSSYGKGVVADIDPQQRTVFDLSDLIPRNELDRKILVALLSKPHSGRVELLRLIFPSSADKEAASRARLNRRIVWLRSSGLVDLRERKVELTRRGKTIAELVRIEDGVWGRRSSDHA